MTWLRVPLRDDETFHDMFSASVPGMCRIPNGGVSGAGVVGATITALVQSSEQLCPRMYSIYPNGLNVCF